MEPVCNFSFYFSDGRHFKSAYGKDFVEALVNGADGAMAELERSTPERLSTQQNQTTSLQGQIDLLRSHQVSQDKLIHFALAREAEEADTRSNERFACFSFFCSHLFACLFVFVFRYLTCFI